MASDLPKIGMPATNALKHIGVTKLEHVAKMTEKELSALHGVGPKAVRILKKEMKAMGLGLKQ